MARTKPEEGRTHYTPEDPEEYAGDALFNEWQTSDLGREFTRELQAVNGEAAAAFDRQASLADFDEKKREEFLNSYVQAFNSLEFQDHRERRDAAVALAQNTYRPLFEQVELAEAGLSKKNEEALRKMGYDSVEKHVVLDGSGNAVGTENIVRARNQEDADAIAALTGGRIMQEQLTRRCDDFAATLYQSNTDPGRAARELHKAFSESMDFVSRGSAEKEKQDPVMDFFQQMQEQEDRKERRKLRNEKMNEIWKESHEALTKSPLEEEKKAEIKQAQFAVKNVFGDIIDQAMEHGQPSILRAALGGLKDADQEFAKKINTGEGFVDAAGHHWQGYQDTSSMDEVKEYLEYASQVITNYKNNMDGYAWLALQKQRDGIARDIEQTEKLEAKPTPDEHQIKEQYESIGRKAQSIAHLTRPK